MELKVQKRSDAQLLELLNCGDQSALDEIYRTQAPHLFRYAIKRLGCNETAADLIQELFLKIWVKRETLIVKGEFASYLTLCLRNLIIDHYSHQQIRNKYLASTSMAETDDQTTELLNYNDTHRVFQTSMSGLPPKMQQVFHLSKIEDLSIDEIAKELDLSRQTVKNQLGNAIKRLRLSMSSFLMIVSFIIFFQK